MSAKGFSNLALAERNNNGLTILFSNHMIHHYDDLEPKGGPDPEKDNSIKTVRALILVAIGYLIILSAIYLIASRNKTTENTATTKGHQTQQ